MIITCSNSEFLLQAPYDYTVFELLGSYTIKLKVRKWFDDVSTPDTAIYLIDSSDYYFKFGMPDELSSAFSLTFETKNLYKGLEEYAEGLIQSAQYAGTSGGYQSMPMFGTAQWSIPTYNSTSTVPYQIPTDSIWSMSSIGGGTVISPGPVADTSGTDTGFISTIKKLF